MSGPVGEKTVENSAAVDTEKSVKSTFSEDKPSTPTTPENVDIEQAANIDGLYLVTKENSNTNLKLASDGTTVLIPQPSDDPEDPLNWSWFRKHKAFAALLLPSLLVDWGMTWGTTMFEAQALDWNMSITSSSHSVSGGIFLQGPGGVLAVPLIQRYGRLPVLFWSQVLACITVIVAAVSPNYACFTAFRTLQGFVATSPQVVGLSVVHDLFFFHERARKVNIWAFTFLFGAFFGPMMASFILQKVDWKADFGILAGWYGFSAILVALCGEETLYDREKGRSPTAGASRISLLLGIAGMRSEGKNSMWEVTRHLVSVGLKPQLLAPCIFILVLFTWAIGIVTTVSQFVLPPPYLLSPTKDSLLYFAPIVGGIVGEFWGHFFNDFLAKLYIKTHNGRYSPENRLWGAYVPCAFGVCAMVLYGQSISKALPVVAIGAAWSFMVFAEVTATTAISAYLLDIFPHHAALASAWLNFWRTTGGFCVTYFQTQWVAKTGAASAFGTQGGIIAGSFIFIILTQIYGRSWRARFLPPAAEI